MPWSTKTFEAVCAGLRDSARKGEFVPFVWNERIDTNDDGGCRFFGCGWGVVGWVAAIMDGGTAWARKMLPVGCTQQQVNAVLMISGLTAEEIETMTPAETWQHFDREMADVYENRLLNWNAYIQKSTQMAEFFISVLQRVAVDDLVKRTHISLVPPVNSQLPLFQHIDPPKATTLFLGPKDMAKLTA